MVSAIPIGLLVYNTIESDWTATIVFVVTLAIIPVGLLCGMLISLAMSHNSYRYTCAEICLKGSDYIQGYGFAEAMGKLGVDKAIGATLITKLAELAIDNEDYKLAEGLYEIGVHKWKSYHARVALQELNNRVP